MLGSQDEARRLEVLRRYNIVDTPPDEVFDRVAFMAAAYFRAPMAVISFLDETRQWFKAVHGLEVRQTARDISFCQYTIKGHGVEVVTDATQDLRFKGNPLVLGSPDLRFYAGAPLWTTDGECLGTVAVLDRVARQPLSQEEERFLQSLADTVVHELEIRLAAANVKEEIERRHASEHGLRLAVTHAPITLAKLDAHLRHTAIFNPPAPWKAENFLGKTAIDIWPGQDGETLMAIHRSVLDSGTTRRIDVSLPIAGDMREFDATVEALTEGDAVVGLSVAAIDVTERKRDQRRLQCAEARHRAVLQTAVDAIVVTDEHGIIQHFNRSATRIFGFSEQEAVGRDVGILMPAAEWSGHHDYIHHYLETGDARIIGVGREVHGQRKDGSLVPLDLQIAEWREGGLRMFTATMRDISQRRQREDALLKAENAREHSAALLKTVIESIPDALFCKDREGRYIVANAATAQVMRTDTVIGKTDYDLLPDSVAARLREFDAQVMASGVPAVVEGLNYDQGEQPSRWYQTTKTPLRDAKGAIVGVVGLARDITERRDMMEALKTARDHAEAANRAKSTFLAAASHDLRQPVQALTLFTSTLETQLGGHPARQVLERMRHSQNALQDLLGALLDISRLDAGAVEVNKERMPLAEILGRVVDDYQGLAQQKGLRFHAIRCRYWTETDPHLLERVVQNLLDNALKYTASGSILIGCRRRGDLIALQVLDTGIGIPPEKVEAVFQEFMQLGNPGRDRTKGLGLGLSIVQRLLELLGHQLTVQSTLGKGTCFTITLPRIAADQNNRPIRGEAPLVAPVGTKQVLVIEDEELVRKGMEMLVGGWGCNVLTAADEREAVAAATAQRMPDLIIADYRLQGGHLGTDAVKAVQQACGRAIPAMIVTGDTAPERIVEVRASGFSLAHKPVAPERLKNFIEKGH